MGNWYGVSGLSSTSFAFPHLLPAKSFAAVASGNPSGNGAADMTVMWEIRKKIGQTASSKVGSQNWLDSGGLDKCNIYVHDVIKEAGQTPPESSKGSVAYRLKYYLGLVDSKNYPAQAGDWANANLTLGCWKTLTIPPTPPGFIGPVPAFPPDISGPGDVIAEAIQYSDATGHVGIVVGSRQTSSADSTALCSGLPPGTITITDYGFRPDNYVSPDGCKLPDGTDARKHGREKFAVVKQFVCF
jgi:hypothetical protein